MAMEPLGRFIDGIDHAFREGDAQVDGKHAEALNVRLLREQYLAMARGDFDAAMGLFHDDVDFEITGPPAVPFLGRWRGRSEVGEAMRRNFAMVEDQEPEIRSLIAQGDIVVVVAHERGRLRASGSPYSLHWVHVCTFHGGKVVRFHEIIDGYAI
jgi:ketosteroid isomerase-like protein